MPKFPGVSALRIGWGTLLDLNFENILRLNPRLAIMTSAGNALINDKETRNVRSSIFKGQCAAFHAGKT